MQLTGIELHRRAPKHTVIPQVLHPLVEKVMYVLPADPAEEETYASVSMVELENRDDWSVRFRRMPSTQPPDWITESQAVDPVAVMEAVAKVWIDQGALSTSLSLHYKLKGWTSDLVHAEGRQFGQLTALEMGSIWMIEGASLVGSLSILSQGVRKPDEPATALTISAGARITTAGWPDLSELEAIAWKDLLGFLRKVST